MSSVARSQGEYREAVESPNIKEVIDLYHNVPIEIYQKGSIQRKIEQQLSSAKKNEVASEDFRSFDRHPDFHPNDRVTFRPDSQEYDPLEDPSLNKFIRPEPIPVEKPIYLEEKPLERYEYKSDFAKRFMDKTSNNSTGVI